MAVGQVRTKQKRRPPKRAHGSPLDKAKTHEVVWPKVSGIFEKTRGVEGIGFVYFIGEQDEGMVKIGFAKDPVARLRGMQTGNPRRLRIERVLVGDLNLEKLLHEFWLPLAVVTPTNSKKPDAPPGTEWFVPEIRERLFPIVDLAAQRQVEYMATMEGEVFFTDFEHFVRDAHKEHDFVVQARHQVRRLAAGGGYVTDRVSRI